MTTRDIGIVLHEEIDRREKLIAQLTTEVDGLKVALGVLERGPEARNLVTNVSPKRRGRKPNGYEPKACKKCGKSAKDGAVFSKNVAMKDGLNNWCKACVAQRYQQSKPPKPNGVIEDATPVRTMVPCQQCGEKFPDAKAMGIHKTRVHFSVQ